MASIFAFTTGGMGGGNHRGSEEHCNFLFVKGSNTERWFTRARKGMDIWDARFIPRREEWRTPNESTWE